MVTVKGPKGELSPSGGSQKFKVAEEESQLVVKRPTDQKRHRAMHGLYRVVNQ